MNRKHILVLMTVFLGLVSHQIFAKARHPFQEKKQFQRYVEKSKHVELFMVGNLPTKPYKEVRFVQVQGLFTKNLDGLHEKLRVKAFKSKGDAVVGIECPRMVKNIGISCHGYIVRWSQ